MTKIIRFSGSSGVLFFLLSSTSLLAISNLAPDPKAHQNSVTNSNACKAAITGSERNAEIAPAEDSTEKRAKVQNAISYFFHRNWMIYPFRSVEFIDDDDLKTREAFGDLVKVSDGTFYQLEPGVAKALTTPPVARALDVIGSLWAAYMHRTQGANPSSKLHISALVQTAKDEDREEGLTNGLGFRVSTSSFKDSKELSAFRNFLSSLQNEGKLTVPHSGEDTITVALNPNFYFELENEIFKNREDEIRDKNAIVSPNGQLIAVIQDKELRILSAVTGEPVVDPRTHQAYEPFHFSREINEVSWAPDSLRLAVDFKRVENFKTEMDLVDLRRRDQTHLRFGYESGSIHNMPLFSSRRIFGNKSWAPALSLSQRFPYDKNTGEFLIPWAAPATPIAAMDWTPDGKYITARVTLEAFRPSNRFHAFLDHLQVFDSRSGDFVLDIGSWTNDQKKIQYYTWDLNNQDLVVKFTDGEIQRWNTFYAAIDSSQYKGQPLFKSIYNRLTEGRRRRQLRKWDSEALLHSASSRATSTAARERNKQSNLLNPLAMKEKQSKVNQKTYFRGVGKNRYASDTEVEVEFLDGNGRFIDAIPGPVVKANLKFSKRNDERYLLIKEGDLRSYVYDIWNQKLAGVEGHASVNWNEDGSLHIVHQKTGKEEDVHPAKFFERIDEE